MCAANNLSCENGLLSGKWNNFFDPVQVFYAWPSLSQFYQHGVTVIMHVIDGE